MVPSGLRRFGGAEGIRTPDLQSAILALSQLSYCPTHFIRRLGIEKKLLFMKAEYVLDNVLTSSPIPGVLSQKQCLPEGSLIYLQRHNDPR